MAAAEPDGAFGHPGGVFPGTQRLTVKMIAERHTGRLLGAQIVGKEGSAKRIDTAATALWNHMTVEEMTALDLAYAPPFSPVWDPILVAARPRPPYAPPPSPTQLRPVTPPRYLA